MKIVDFPKATMQNILQTTKALKAEGVINPYIICQKHNIDYSFIDIESPLAYTAYNAIRGGFDIYISNKVDNYSAKILCYHELGHIFCESPHAVSLFDHQIDPNSEFIANFFASLMIPVAERFTINSDTSIEEFNEYISKQIYKKNIVESILHS